MGAKIIKLVLFFILLACSQLSIIAQDSDYGLVRVGITDNKFQNVLRQNIILYGTADCDICDKATKKVLTRVPANSDIVVRNNLTGIDVIVNNTGATLRDFVIVCPTGLLGVRDLKRKGEPAVYHGAFELIQNEPENDDFMSFVRSFSENQNLLPYKE